MLSTRITAVYGAAKRSDKGGAARPGGAAAATASARGGRPALGLVDERLAVDAVLENVNCGIVLMHMQRDPLSMQFNPEYQDVILEVMQFLKERANLLLTKGIERDRIALDPGFGFGKSLEHNIEMLAKFDRFSDSGYPVLAGISRKSMLGKITGKEADQRLAPSVAAAIKAADRGAKIIRVHDVPETVDALKLWEAVNT